MHSSVLEPHLKIICLKYNCFSIACHKFNRYNIKYIQIKCQRVQSSIVSATRKEFAIIVKVEGTGTPEGIKLPSVT